MTSHPPAIALSKRLRDACESVRRKSFPLADLIPLFQQAADALDAASHPPAPQQVVPDLHAAIMNLPCTIDGFVGAERSYVGAYQKGHRDARHAAAELVQQVALPTARVLTARMLTLGEFEAGCGRFHNPSHVRAAIRKFCEVNGITLNEQEQKNG